MMHRGKLCGAGGWALMALVMGCGSSESSISAHMSEPVAGPAVVTMTPSPMAAAPVAMEPAPAPTPMPSSPTATPPAVQPDFAGAPPAAPAMDECGLNTKYDGDEYCILPPPPDKGFQLHIGPSNYDNPEPEYLLEPGQEDTSGFSGVSSNTTPIYFYYRQFRMRPGAHHNIITTTADEEMRFGMGSRIGTTNHLAEDSPKHGVIAPENEGVGIPLAPNSPIGVSLHSINVTERPQLREMWVNFWYRDPELVKEPVEQLFAGGDPSFEIQPGEDTVLGPYRCEATGSGRMLWFYGHRHANNVRFSAWRIRGGVRELFYEAYDWEEPLVLEFSSTVTNATPDRGRQIEGGWSGILDIEAGDQLEWECHVVNKTDAALRFSNNTYTGEMCIIDAELVGANCRSQRESAPEP
jgi:hypothetical protein